MQHILDPQHSGNLCNGSIRQPAQRVAAAGRVSFKCAPDGSTRLDRLYQSDSAKIRLPKVHGAMCEAVLINTAGGLTGGDDLSWDVDVGRDCQAVVTTQACEKIYRSDKGSANINSNIRIGAGGMLHWLPQETILFDRSSLNRNIKIEMVVDGRLLMVESVVIGRAAMGEMVEQAGFHDCWRIYRDNRLIHAEDARFEGNPSTDFDSLALLDGKRVFASLLYVGPEGDDALDAIVGNIRNILPLNAGISAFNGKLVLRMLARDSYDLRASLIPVINLLRGGIPLPRVWNL